MDTNLTVNQAAGILKHVNAQSLLQAVADTTNPVDAWLGELVLLNNIPFQNLVPDTRLLPNESLRFFYVDTNWLYALIDGAISIASNTSLETQFTAIMAGTLRDKGSVTAQKMRSKLLGLTEEANAATPALPAKLLSGLLLRSSIITAFPGVKIFANYPSGYNGVTKPLRYENVGDDLILIIFPAVPVSVTIQQPPHGLQFGIADGNGAQPANGVLSLRNVSGTNTGAQITDSKKQPVTLSVPYTGDASIFRPGGKNVIDVKKLAGAIETGLIANNAIPAGSEITSSQFVMQLINAPDEVTYPNSLNKN